MFIQNKKSRDREQKAKDSKYLARGTEDIKHVLRHNKYFTNVLTDCQICDVAKKVTQHNERAHLCLSAEQLFSLATFVNADSWIAPANNLQIKKKGRGYKKGTHLTTKDGRWAIVVTKVDNHGGIMDFSETKIDEKYNDLYEEKGRTREFTREFTRELKPLDGKDSPGDTGATAGAGHGAGATVSGPYFLLIGETKKKKKCCGSSKDMTECCGSSKDMTDLQDIKGKYPTEGKSGSRNSLKQMVGRDPDTKVAGKWVVMSVEDFKAALGGSLDKEFRGPLQSSMCSKYDYITGQKRHCWAESRKCRLILVLLVLLLALGLLHFAMTIQLYQLDSYPSSKFQEYLKDNLRVPLNNSHNSSKFFSYNIASAGVSCSITVQELDKSNQIKTDIDADGIYAFNKGILHTPTMIAPNFPGGQLVHNFQLATGGEIVLEPVCRLVIMIDPTVPATIHVHADEHGLIELRGKRAILPLLNITATSGHSAYQAGNMQQPEISVSLMDNSIFNALHVYATWVTVQIVDTLIDTVDVVSQRGWVDINAAGAATLSPMILRTNARTGMCLKSPHIESVYNQSIIAMGIEEHHFYPGKISAHSGMLDDGEDGGYEYYKCQDTCNKDEMTVDETGQFSFGNTKYRRGRCEDADTTLREKRDLCPRGTDCSDCGSRKVTPPPGVLCAKEGELCQCIGAVVFNLNLVLKESTLTRFLAGTLESVPCNRPSSLPNASVVPTKGQCMCVPFPEPFLPYKVVHVDVRFTGSGALYVVHGLGAHALAKDAKLRYELKNTMVPNKQLNLTRKDLARRMELLDTKHPMLSLTRLDLKAPLLSSTSFFASDEVLLRFRPVFFAVISGTLLSASKATAKLTFTSMPCVSEREQSWCAPKENSTGMSLCRNSIDTAVEAQQLLDYAVLDSMAQFLRQEFLDPLRKKENEFMTETIYRRYIFAAQKHKGKHMNNLIAWTHNGMNFVRDVTFGLRGIDSAVLILSFGIVFFVLVLAVIGIWKGLGIVREHLVSSTLLNDPEVLKDIRTIEDIDNHAFYTEGSGIMHSSSWSIKMDPRCCVLNSCSCFRILWIMISATIFLGIIMISFLFEQFVDRKRNEIIFYFSVGVFFVCGFMQFVVWCCKRNDRKLSGAMKSQSSDEKMKEKLEKQHRDDPPPMCCCFRVLCCIRRKKKKRKAKARDVADTKSSWFKMIQTMAEDYPSNNNKSKNTNQVAPTPTDDDELTQPESKSDHDEDEDEETGHLLTSTSYNFETLQCTTRRLVNRVSLIASFTDVMYFIEALMPSKAPKASQTSAVIYYEMSHSSLLLEFVVAIFQMTVVFIIAAPVVFFALAWAYYETFYFGDLLGEPDRAGEDGFGQDIQPLICTYGLPEVITWSNGHSLRIADCSQPVYIRLATFIVVIIVSALVYLGLEYLNAMNLYLLHGTKAERFGEHHRLLEWRRIAEDQALRERRFSIDSSSANSSWAKLKGVKHKHVYKGPWREVCCKPSCKVFKYNGFAVVYHWFHAMWCGNQGTCCHRAWAGEWPFCCWRRKKFNEGDQVAVKLPGWTNKFLANIISSQGKNEDLTYDIEFLSKEFDVNKKKLMKKQKEHRQISATAEIIPEARAEVGDLLLARKPLIESGSNPKKHSKQDFISFVCIVTKTFGKGLQRRHLVRIVPNESEKGPEEIRRKKYYKKSFELEVDATEIEYIFHSYPRLTWWDKKENEPMYLCFQINFRACLNVFRSIFFIASMFVLFGAALWCILGVFIFPEKFAPYSTAIFTTALNVKVLYGQSVAKLEELESRLIEGVKNLRLVTTIAGLRRHAASFGTSDRGGAAGKQQTKVHDIHARMINFLKNPSEAGLSDADLFEDATFVTLRDSGEFKDLENLKDKLGKYLLLLYILLRLLLLLLLLFLLLLLLYACNRTARY